METEIFVNMLSWSSAEETYAASSALLFKVSLKGGGLNSNT